jgi:hypothetical protein
MSAESAPISLSRFAAALHDLPISALYAKHAELTNSLAHLESSNQQLADFAREHDDRDCYEALLENRQVVKNMRERVDAVRSEVEVVRGLLWMPGDEVLKREEGRIRRADASWTRNWRCRPCDSRRLCGRPEVWCRG